MKVFIINLKRSEGRRQRMEKALAGLGLDYEFFEGVDGYQLSNEDIKSFVDPSNEYPRVFKPGEIGCFLSHYNIFKRIAAERIPYALILEDDVEISRKMPGLLKDLEGKIFQGDVIHLYSSFPSSCKLTAEGSINRDYRFIRPEEGELVVGNVAYIISQSVAENMVKALLPINNVIDDWRFWIEKGLVKDFKIVFPHPVDLSDHYSDIHESYGGVGLKLRKLIMHYNVPVLSDYIIRKRKIQRWDARRQLIRIDNVHPDKIFD